MILETLGHRRSTRWLLVGGAVLGIWASFSATSRSPVVSQWAGDAQVAAVAPKSSTLR